MKEGIWAWYFLGALVVVALLADLIANDRPIVAKYGGEVVAPILSGNTEVRDWKRVDLEWAVWPPIPFRAGTTDLANGNYRPPFAAPKGDKGRHWLGTDRLGRDTAAGLVNGTRVAVLVGVGSLIISLLVGVLLGALAGFFGNNGLLLPRYLLWIAGVVIILGVAYTFGVLVPALGAPLGILLGFVVITLGILLLAGLIRPLARRSSWLSRPVGVPIDRLVMLVLELTVSIPALVILISILSIVSRPSIWLVVIIIGLLGWTPVVRFLRAELLRIRELPYIDAARVSGIGKLRILFGHALPNALQPVLVVAAFLVGIAVLSEAMLSFLGVGVPSDQVTWGSMLQQSRLQPRSWWLTLFPGLLLTLTVLACNTLGRGSRVMR